ncbi:MAG: isochorismatase family protein [Candidatus Latescibacteria bacterium]|nr:isochorismatase family protein [Candidatus Latescibacterota bacterium]
MSDFLTLDLTSQVLDQDEGGHNHWRQVTQRREWPCQQTALLLCDVWDRHWSRGANERVGAMVGRMDQLTRALRERGVHIIHAPSDTMEFYEGTPARQRVLEAPAVESPAQIERPDPPQPIDASDHGSDTPGDEPHKAWHRQHPGIFIDQQRDGIGDNGGQVYNFMAQRGVGHMLIMGVHTNMCVLERSFAIKQMVKWGVEIALVRDLTDTMYNPASPPYVSHEEGTRLVIEYIEKFWCPTLTSRAILGE